MVRDSDVAQMGQGINVLGDSVDTHKAAQGEATVAAGASDASLSFSGTEPGTLGKAFASLGLPKASHSGRGHRAASAVV